MGFFNQTVDASGVSDKSPKTDRTEKTVIAEGTECTGEFNIAGEMHIDGNIRGTILSESFVFVGVSGVVLGDIQADKIIISGKVEGNVVCNTLEVMQSGEVKGEISTGKLVIEPGGTFIGNSRKIDASMADALPRNHETRLLESSVTEAEIDV